jgi:hypothetical protein
MRTFSYTHAEALPTALPPAGAHLYGFVDATVAGYRELRVGSTTYTIASAVTRGDALAAALTTAGVPTTYANGLFTVSPSPANTIRPVDRLGVLLGLFSRANTVAHPSTSSLTSERISPVAIPLAGFAVTMQRIQSDDEMLQDRLLRQTGYVYGSARVFDVRVTLHKWALQALLFGWCMTGKVAFVGPDTALISGAAPDGSLTARVLSVSEPTFIGASQLWAEVTFTVTMEDP